MDSVVAQLLARLNMFLTQELDFQVDSRRFAEDPEYAAQVLGLVDEMGDHEFETVAAQIRKRQLELFSLKSTSVRSDDSDTSSSSVPDETPSPPGKHA